MVKGNRKTAPRRVKKPAAGTRQMQTPPDTYEEWLKKQSVKHSRKKTEGQIPVDSYENWIRDQVKKHVAAVVV